MSKHRIVRWMAAVAASVSLMAAVPGLAGQHDLAAEAQGAAAATVVREQRSSSEGTAQQEAVAPAAARKADDVGATPSGKPRTPSKSKRSLIVALPLAVAGGTAAALMLGKGSAPTVSGIGIAPSPSSITGLAAVTEFRFTPEGVDASADALSYSWDFGDGSNATGSSVTHVFEQAGSYTIRLIVGAGGGEASTSRTLAVADVSGTWSWRYLNEATPRMTYRMTQDGTTVTGTDEVEVHAGGGVYPFKGTLSRERVLRITFDDSRCVEDGNVSDDARTIRGVVDCSGYADYPFGNVYEMIRQ